MIHYFLRVNDFKILNYLYSWYLKSICNQCIYTHTYIYNNFNEFFNFSIHNKHAFYRLKDYFDFILITMTSTF